VSEPVGDDFERDGLCLSNGFGASATVRESPNRVDSRDRPSLSLSTPIVNCTPEA
jgi:hypothetical protein